MIKIGDEIALMERQSNLPFFKSKVDVKTMKSTHPDRDEFAKIEREIYDRLIISTYKQITFPKLQR
jgi:hypothetical protein